MNQRDAELKRFLDRLLSQTERMPRHDMENRQAAVELGIVDPGPTASTQLQVSHEQLIELTRNAILGTQPDKAPDQKLETMSAPPPMPEAVP